MLFHACIVHVCSMKAICINFVVKYHVTELLCFTAIHKSSHGIVKCNRKSYQGMHICLTCFMNTVNSNTISPTTQESYHISTRPLCHLQGFCCSSDREQLFFITAISTAV